MITWIKGSLQEVSAFTGVEAKSTVTEGTDFVTFDNFRQSGLDWASVLNKKPELTAAYIHVRISPNLLSTLQLYARLARLRKTGSAIIIVITDNIFLIFSTQTT